MMNRHLLVSMGLLIFVFLNLNGMASASLNLVLTKQNPYPVEPGKTFDIEVALQNSGYTDVSDVSLGINPKDPFSLIPGQEVIKTFSQIPSGDQVTTTYKLYVNKNTISGKYPIEFYVQNENGVKIVYDVDIQVQGKPKLIIDHIETKPDVVKPGDDVVMDVYIKNEGTGSATHVEMSVITNTTYILPILSGGNFYIDVIPPGEMKVAEFRLNVDISAEYMTYPGMIAVAYEDDSGSPNYNTFSFGLPVRGKPIIDILSAKVDKNDFKVDIENIGTSTAKALVIQLIQNDNVRDVAIASELKPSKHKTIRFSGFEYGNAVINITYLDETNKKFSEEIPISIKQSFLTETQKTGSFPVVSIVLFLLLIAESIYIWKLRKRLKKR